MSLKQIRALFAVAGAYDLLIGLAFLLRGPGLFDWAGVPHPSHWGYIQFSAAMLIVFGLMFLAVAAKPAANRNLIPFGMLLKVSYVSVVGYYWATSGCPLLFKPFLVIDVIMLVLFWFAYFASAIRTTNLAAS